MSKIQLSFVYDGERYVTLFGCSEYLKSALLPNSNVGLVKTVMSSSGYSAAFNQISDYNIRSVPIVENASVEKSGDVYLVTGEATIGDTRYTVNIDETHVTVFTDDEDESVESEQTIEEPASEPTVESLEPVQETSTEKLAKEAEIDPEPKTVEPEKPEPVKTESNVKVGVVSKGRSGLLRSTALDAAAKNKGLTFSDKPIVDVQPFVIGGTTNNESGFYVGGHMYQPNIKKNRERMVQREINERAKLRAKNNTPIQGSVQTAGQWSNKSTRRFTPERPYKPEVLNHEPEVLQETEEPPKPTHDMPLKDYFSMSSNPSDGADKEGVEESRHPMQDVIAAVNALHDNKAATEKVAEHKTEVKGVSNEERMQEILQSLDPAIANILPDVPISILQSITEFTLKPVDVELLQQRGHVYCIDNRWHKCGTWFCIDYVDEAVRYFYETKQGIIFTLPFNICKDWVAANGC